MLLDLSVATNSIIKMLTEQDTVLDVFVLILGKHTLIVQSCLILPNHFDIEKTKPIKNKKRKYNAAIFQKYAPTLVNSYKQGIHGIKLVLYKSV